MLKLIIFYQKIKSILKKKIIFFVPKKDDVLVYRKDSKEILCKLFGVKNLQHVDPLLEVNLYVLFLTIFQCVKSKYFWVPYLQKYIEITQPKILVTRIANDLIFYLLKKKNNQGTKFISIQNGLNIGNHPLLIENICKSIRGKLSVDYIFCYNDGEKKIYQNVIHGKFLITGSIINNQIKKKIKNKKKKNILFLSVYRHRKGNNFSTHHNEYFRKVTYKEYFELEKKILNFLINYTKKYNYNLIICGSREDVSFRQEEKYFYKKLIGNKFWKYTPKVSVDSNYILSDKSSITVNIESCLGYESLARGNKVAFFSCRGQHLKVKSYDFRLNNYKLKNIGSFWTSKYNEKKFENILNMLREIAEKSWIKCVKNYRQEVFCYDPGNKIAKKVIKKILLKI